MMKIINGIPIWGDPIDDGALAQIILSSRQASKSALMADHHLGYAVPIGGVLAYENAVSPSGVGYDIGCFTGETRIFTIDGQMPTLAEVEGRDDLFVPASLPNGRIVPAKATCRMTRRDCALVEVELDNGEIIRCTPDHQFMLRDGTYHDAESLVAANSLMPFYMTPDKDGYILVRNNETGRLVRLHWLVYHAGLTEPKPDLPPGEELVLHHIDFCKTNNDPRNIRPMGKVSHDAYHAACRDKSHFNTPEFTTRRLDGIQRFWSEARQDIAFMTKRAETAWTNSRSGTPAQRSYRARFNGHRGRKYLIRYNLDPETIRHNRERAGSPHPCELCGEVAKATSSLYYHMRREHPEHQMADNHKVVAVRRLAHTADVYCLDVPEYHNFALAAGVFVHNCGNKAVRLDIQAKELNAAAAMDLIYSNLSFGIGRSNERAPDSPLFDDVAWSIVPELKDRAKAQLGTIGSGNHYVDLFEDEINNAWVGVHFGSRGFGHGVATKFLTAGGAADGMDVEPLVLQLGTTLGDDYMEAMRLAGEYAYAGRNWVCEEVARLLGARIVEEIHNHHNYAWREEHSGKDYIVVRKGATPAFPGQRGFIGGTMGENAVIIEGVEHPDQALGLYSTVHGAGRVMSRTAAKGKKGKPGLISELDMRNWIDKVGVELRGAGLDEAPQAYKRLPEVLKHHENTIRVIHTLRPLGVAMAGAKEIDPYKD